jgi:hypothetical protein
MVGSCEYGNELPDCIKRGEFLASSAIISFYAPWS